MFNNNNFFNYIINTAANSMNNRIAAQSIMYNLVPNLSNQENRININQEDTSLLIICGKSVCGSQANPIYNFCAR